VGRSASGEREPVCAAKEGLRADPATRTMSSGGVWEAVSRAWALFQARNAGPTRNSGYAVRRLSVAECEFLMGFPRNYTAIAYRGKPAADGPRYKALGNSMAVPVLKYIGERIKLINSLQK